MRIATAPVSWGIFEIEGMGAQRSYAEVLDEMSQAGYEGTELGPYGYLPSDPIHLRAELARRYLELVTAFVPVPLSEPERFERAFADVLRTADLLSALGVTLLVVADALTPHRMAIAGRVTPEDGLAESQWETAVAFLHRIAAACRARGLRVAFHHHAGTFIETPQEIERLLAMTDPEAIGLCLDTGHFVYGGGDPIHAVRTYGPRIWHVHAKDVDPKVLERVRREPLTFTEAVRAGLFCPLGDGLVDFPTLIRELRGQHYRGWIVVEQDVDPSHPNANPLRDAMRSQIYLRQIFEHLDLTD
ncbi:MAG: TIM barrel protein [Blastocatellia bacterium]|nr:TIM barrel protein [Blastocatellia bacterium]MCS7156360.1 TIM barrel protein [Blastocatellia bacterium]MCX7751289.1 TIM barrel protein [Blastocatellia bacterium]MDW8169001.1 TIM barrel protein [Acidobacteriota bacterium]MDW8256760.1 TIM barrel protein [Acidobacteriota bacterium]